MNSWEKLKAIEENIEKVFLGKADAVRMIMVGLLSGGHMLIEDIPGVGKTLLARALAKSIHCTFKRVQFTADMLPSDVLGVSIYDPDRKEFIFKPGPVFANILLADELNRCPPRTQSSLLEAMNEQQVTADGELHPLPKPFVVIATQNPFDLEGTYPLPESQRDRFLMRLSVGYPQRADEKKILERQLTTHSVEELEAVATEEDVIELQNEAHDIRMDDGLMDYILHIIEQTRTDERLSYGVSPRGALMLSQAARSMAMLEGRDYCLPDDIKRLAIPVLLHRLLHRADIGGTSESAATDVLEEIVENAPVPV